MFFLCKYVTNKGAHKTAAISFFVAIEVRKQKADIDCGVMLFECKFTCFINHIYKFQIDI